jgi:beta-lactamase class A
MKDVAATHTARATTRARRSQTPTAEQYLASAVASLVTRDDDHVAVAVDDLTTGKSASYNGTNTEFITASIIKADILATLLHQTDDDLTSYEQELATTMIENSDNDSATALYQEIGGASALAAANKTFGLTQTTPSVHWGLTTTTADDQLEILRQIFTSDSVLSAASRSYIQGLMSQVEADQRWGVSAAASSGTTYYVKNGWDPHPVLWEINSIGEITHDGQRMLIAVLSRYNASESSGISLIQQVAEAAATGMART